MLHPRKRHAFVLGSATFSLILTLSGIWLSGIWQFLPDYLFLLGTFVSPVGGIIMVDFWLHYRGRFPELSLPQPNFNWAGVIAYIVGSSIA